MRTWLGFAHHVRRNGHLFQKFAESSIAADLAKVGYLVLKIFSWIKIPTDNKSK